MSTKESVQSPGSHPPPATAQGEATSQSAGWGLDRSLTPLRSTYVGFFLVTFATLMYELLLTRIFSVSMWYHFAFMSISVALFGLSVGAVIVHSFPRYFVASKTHERMAQSALLFAVAIVVSFLTHLSVPFSPGLSPVALYSIALTYVALAIPFTCSGICVCLALTRFTHSVSRLYATDLAGAAVGCVAVILLLNVADGPSAVLLVAATAGCAAIVFTPRTAAPWLRRTAVLATLLLTVCGVGNALLAAAQHPGLYLLWVKGVREPRPLYEKWNPLGRVQVTGDPLTPRIPYGFGLGTRYPHDDLVRYLELTVDATSLTIMNQFDGTFAGLDHLNYSVTNVAHFLKSAADVLIVGTGGGRDILSALAFDQQSVVGVELNSAAITAVDDVYGEFTGHLDQNPKVHVVNDEARSFVRGTEQRFDIIQISLISGAFILSEQPLYTLEAWRLFLDRLKPGGILSVTRVFAPDSPAEMYRATSLAYAALREGGVSEPRTHLVVVRSAPAAQARGDTLGTLLVNERAFSDAELDTIERVSEERGFEVVLSPRAAVDPVFAELASGRTSVRGVNTGPLNLTPPTDDNPFFFNMLRFSDLLDSTAWRQAALAFNLQAVAGLAALLVVVLGLTIAGILLPLRLAPTGASGSVTAPLATYFGAIGLAYIFIEIAQMQMLTLFLGHPTYSLGVVLATLLICSGLGSWLTGRVAVNGASRWGPRRLLVLILMLVVFAVLAPALLQGLGRISTPLRIAAAVAMIAPLGVMMGMPLPLGMKLAAEQSMGSTPWLWGINGATSVCGSVVAMVLAVHFGITVTLWAGIAAYCVAAVAYWWTSRIRATKPAAAWDRPVVSY